ncbi:phospholipase A1 member A-like isoform X2 [Choristoneura fumiferana]
MTMQPSETDMLSARNARNSYHLFTRNNPTASQTLVLNDAASIQSSNFNPSWPTIAVCHGYTQSRNSELNQVIRDAYLGSGDFNVIILDWSRIAQMDYFSAINAIPSVGQGLGDLLLFINQVTGASLQSMHVMGFSLGAHVAGNAGRRMDGRIGRVTGLDPVSPVWTINRNRLARTDGIYVECIHTYGNGGGTAYGDADFYVNGGDSQPGCLLSLCSHNRAWQIFAATVTYNHLIGHQCDTQREITTGTCAGPELPMGNSDANKTGSGLYYVTAGRSYPY